MAPFDRSHTRPYSSSIVIMTISCTVFEIRRDNGRKRQVFIPLVFNLHDPPDSFRIFAKNFNIDCASPCSIRRCKNIAEKFKSVPRVQQRHRRQTDDRRTAHSIINESINHPNLLWRLTAKVRRRRHTT